MAEYQTSDYDVIVIGAGGAGLRAAIEASSLGVRVALICKSCGKQTRIGYRVDEKSKTRICKKCGAEV